MAEEQILKKQRVDESDPAGGPAAGTRKTRPCAKFFSVSGCPYWSGCNFLHSNPTGAPIAGLPMASRAQAAPMGGYGAGAEHTGPDARRKTKLCNKFQSATGCPFGDKCNFAHGDHEVSQSRPAGMAGGKRTYDTMNPMGTQYPQQQQQYQQYSQYPQYGQAQDAYGSVAMANATMTIRADAVGVVIGKGGANVKQINAMSGARVKIADASDSNSTTRVVEMSGTVEQITVAQDLVRAFVNQFQTSQAAGGGMPPNMAGAAAGGQKVAPLNFKTRMCENFAKGACNYGDRCHFAHGDQDMRGDQLAAAAGAGAQPQSIGPEAQPHQ